MLSRRSFVLCSCAGVLVHGRASAAQDDEPFICATVEPIPQSGNEISIVNFSAAPAQNPVAIVDLNAVAEEFSLTPFGMRSFGLRWRKADSLTEMSAPIVLGVHFMGGDPSGAGVLPH